MLTPNIDVSALLELDKDLEQLSKSQRKKVLRKATRAGARILQKEARRRAPRRSGKLSKNIMVANNRRATDTYAAAGVYVRGSNAKGTNSDTRIKKGDPKNSYYWRFLEDGTSRISPRPFIRPAFDAKEAEAAKVAIDIALEEIDRIFSK